MAVYQDGNHRIEANASVIPPRRITMATFLPQGTWFYQIGLVLYPPSGAEWDQESHPQMMIVTLLFTWHNATIFVLMTLAGGLVYLRVKALPPSTLYHSLHPLHPHHASLRDFDTSDCAKGSILQQDSDEEEV